ncbi:hypothetical protein [Lysobacter sp. CA199]|uniref:hypothetical protein n=1 Tax=Lysobacter sp. CA199 TaxID=3455608 RepID=UPI003F8D008B
MDWNESMPLSDLIPSATDSSVRVLSFRWSDMYVGYALPIVRRCFEVHAETVLFDLILSAAIDAMLVDDKGFHCGASNGEGALSRKAWLSGKADIDSVSLFANPCEAQNLLI